MAETRDSRRTGPTQVWFECGLRPHLPLRLSAENNFQFVLVRKKALSKPRFQDGSPAGEFNVLNRRRGEVHVECIFGNGCGFASLAGVCASDLPIREICLIFSRVAETLLAQALPRIPIPHIRAATSYPPP